MTTQHATQHAPATPATQSAGLCFRCEHRARYLETGERPRYECGNADSQVYGCGPGWLGMTLPALQGMGSKYGARQCSGIVHFGLTTFDVEGGALLGWAAHTLDVREQAAHVFKA